MTTCQLQSILQFFSIALTHFSNSLTILYLNEKQHTLWEYILLFIDTDYL